MKKNFLIAGILAGIALICALCIAGMNMLTNNIIAENAAKTELETCKAIFSDYDAEKSVNLEVTGNTITKKVLAKNSQEDELGFLYTVSGKNSYGAITLMVAIKDGMVYQVEFLENGQSFASTVDSHVKGSYPSSKDETKHFGFQPDKAGAVDALDGNALAGIDTSCGATYGANLVKELVTVALNDAMGGSQNE